MGHMQVKTASSNVDSAQSRAIVSIEGTGTTCAFMPASIMQELIISPTRRAFWFLMLVVVILASSACQGHEPDPCNPEEEWLKAQVEREGSWECDRATLLLLYEHINSSVSPTHYGTLSEMPTDLWPWVRDTDRGRVTELSIAFGNGGTLRPEIANLTELKSLYVSGNDLTGTIPPQIARLERLEYLNLGNNRFSGPIPPEIGNLRRLETLFLEGNYLTGGIPPELGRLSRLNELYLFGNPLGGLIPDELGNLTSLVELGLSNMQLSGEIPESIGQLPILRFFAIQNNRITGQIPVSFAFRNTERSVQINVKGTLLTGCVPRTVRLDLNANELSERALRYC